MFTREICEHIRASGTIQVFEDDTREMEAYDIDFLVESTGWRHGARGDMKYFYGDANTELTLHEVLKFIRIV